MKMIDKQNIKMKRNSCMVSKRTFSDSWIKGVRVWEGGNWKFMVEMRD